jgi:hypothetical protein
MILAVAYGTLPNGLTYAEICGLYQLRKIAAFERLKSASQAVKIGLNGGFAEEMGALE